MQAINSILSNVTSKTAEQRGRKPGDELSLYLRVNGILDIFGEGRFQSAIS